MTVPNIRNAHDPETRNIINATIDSVNAQGKSIQDLVANGQLTTEEYIELITVINQLVKSGDIDKEDLGQALLSELNNIDKQLKNKTDKGNITTSDLDKNNFAIDQTMITDSLRRIITGNTPINAVPADDSITTKKITDGAVVPSKVSKNIATGLLLKEKHDSPPIDFDFVNKEIKIVTDARIYHQGKTYFLSAETTPPLSMEGFGTSQQILYYDTATSTLGRTVQMRLDDPTTTFYIPDSAIVFGAVNPRYEKVYGIESYTINGGESLTERLGFLVGFPAQITFSSTKKTLETSSTVRLLSDGKTIYAGNIIFDFSELRSVIHNLYYDVNIESFGAVEYNQTVPPSAIVFGAFHPDLSQIMFIPQFNVDGKEFKYDTGGSSDSSGIIKNGFYAGEAENFNFDFRNQRIVVSGLRAKRIVSNNNHYLLENQILDISHLYSGSGLAINYMHGLYYNVETGLLDARGFAQVPDDNEVLFATFSHYYHQVNNVENCYINGKPRNNLLQVRDRNSYVEDLKKSELYTSPILEDAGDETEGDIKNIKSSDLYGLYDDLMARFPDYITKYTLNNERTGLPIYRYDFKAPEVKNLSDNAKKPKVFVTSGVHGHEKTATWVTYQAFKQICENWKDHDAVEDLHWNVHFIVIPVANPWGIDRFIKQNSNGVDINRSFPDGWILRDETRIDYGGTHPLTEIEAQNISEILLNEDILFFIDVHNFQSNPDENRFLWTPVYSPIALTLGKSFVSFMSRKWKPEHSFLPQGDYEYFGDANMGVRSTTYSYGTYVGVQSAIFETKESMIYEPGGAWYSSLTVTLGTEALINYLYLISKNRKTIEN